MELQDPGDLPLPSRSCPTHESASSSFFSFLFLLLQGPGTPIFNPASQEVVWTYLKQVLLAPSSSVTPL